MVKSMFAGVSGLKAHQSRMDVIGNNIANVNTVGYKSQSVTFKDSIYTTMIQPSGRSTANGGSAGSNAGQLGYGSIVGNINTDFTTSYPTYTGKGLNIANTGTGFFLVGPRYDGAANGTDAAKTPYELSLSKVGEFNVKNGYLVDGGGNYVYGCPTQSFDANDIPTIYGMDPDGSGGFKMKANQGDVVPLKLPVDADGKAPDGGKWNTCTVDNNGKITGTTTEGGSYVVGYLPLVSVENPNGMLKSEGYYYDLAEADNTGAAGNATIVMAGGSAGSLLSGYLEASNVELAQQFSDMITTQRGYQANAKIITVTDEMLEQLVNIKR